LGRREGRLTGPDQLAGYPPLQHRIRLEPDRVAIPRRFQLAVEGRFGEGGGAMKELRDPSVVVPCDHLQQHPVPVFRTGVIAPSEHDPFPVAKLIEQEQRGVRSSTRSARCRRLTADSRVSR